MLNSASYNWYSTNSYRRFNHQNVQQPPPLPSLSQSHSEANFEQFSDEGRVPLGKASDPDAFEMQKQILDAVDEETLQKWELFRKEMREECLLARRQLGLPIEEVEERYRYYPEKKHDFEAESDASHYTSDRSKYVLNRKLNPLPSTSSAPSPRLTDDEILIEELSLIPKTRSNLAVDEDNKIHSSSSSTIFSPHKPSIQRPLRKPATSSTGSTPSSSPSSTSPECTLFKYGHCPNTQTCGRTHNGVNTLDEKKSRIPIPVVVWQRKLPTIPMCPGYTNMQCWDNKCKLRHAIYPSDFM